MDSLLNLCVEKNKGSALELKMMELRKQLAKVRAAQENYLIDRQTTNNAVASKKVAKTRVVSLKKGLQGTKSSYEQALLTQTSKISSLKAQLVSEMKKAEGIEYEKHGAEACL